MRRLIALLLCVFFAGCANGDGADFAAEEYDYVIIGGGLAGLVVANRLSANANLSVAVIEAGASGYDEPTRFSVPAANLYESSVGTRYDWQFRTAPQPHLNGRGVAWPRGKVLGGSSAINGLYYIRHSEAEQNAWAGLLAGDEHADKWRWESMLRAMQKSETFSPPCAALADALAETALPPLANDGAHGTTGPLHVSYVPTTFPLIAAFFDTVDALGVPMSADPDAGMSAGAFLAASNIDPRNATRSFSRNAYLDPVASRPNLHVLTGHTATKILFTRHSDGVVRATGVQYAANASASVYTARAAREVILCAGAVNSPQLLQLSGVGDGRLLASLGLEVQVDLPGVGYHLQDHVTAALHFTPATNTAMPLSHLTGNTSLDSFVNSAVAYVPGETLFGPDEWHTLLATIRTNQSEAVGGIYHDAPSSVRAGYEATYAAQERVLRDGGAGAPVEFLFALSYGQVHIIAALQAPFSRGRIGVTSPDPFAAPHIDPRYLSLASDRAILRTALELARAMSTTPPLSTLLGAQTPPLLPDEAGWEEWMARDAGTEYHPSSSCAMLPRALGGVVDAALRVHGTSNVRVIDASVPPIPLAAHLASLTYGIAEIGADIILADHTRSDTPLPSAASGTSGTPALTPALTLTALTLALALC